MKKTLQVRRVADLPVNAKVAMIALASSTGRVDRTIAVIGDEWISSSEILIKLGVKALAESGDIKGATDLAIESLQALSALVRVGLLDFRMIGPEGKTAESS